MTSSPFGRTAKNRPCSKKSLKKAKRKKCRNGFPWIPSPLARKWFPSLGERDGNHFRAQGLGIHGKPFRHCFLFAFFKDFLEQGRFFAVLPNGDDVIFLHLERRNRYS